MLRCSAPIKSQLNVLIQLIVMVQRTIIFVTMALLQRDNKGAVHRNINKVSATRWMSQIIMR